MTAARLPGVSMRPDAAGRVRYQVRVRRAGRYFTGTFATAAEALAWRAQALEAADGREAPPTPPTRAVTEAPTRAVTVADAARRLCRGMVDGTVRARDGRCFKPSTTRKYELALRHSVLPRIGRMPVSALTRGDLQRLVDEVAAEFTAEHARKALTAVRVALRVAERYGEIETNPCAGVRVPMDADGEKRPRILTPEEAAAIIAAAEAEDAQWTRSFAAPLIRLAFGSGLRLGEILALPWGREGLDLDAGTVHVRRSVDRVREPATGAYPFIPPKSRASRRDVPLAAEDIAALRRHRLATGRAEDGVLVFPAADGGPLSPVPAYRAFKRAAAKAGIDPPPRLHDARHAYATHGLAAGLSAHAVAALLGHSDAALVWRRYGHALPDEVAGAGAALAAFRAARGV